MRKQSVARAVLISGAVIAFLAAGPVVQARAETIDPSPAIPSGLSAEQQAAIQNLNTPVTVQGGAQLSKPTISKGTDATCSTKSRSDKLYRGSFLMWAEDNMKFFYRTCENKVTSSSLTQRAGYVFPNISKATGANRYYSVKSNQRWHGNYTIGAGIVTPWGDVKVYGADYYTNWSVSGSGAYSGSWAN